MKRYAAGVAVAALVLAAVVVRPSRALGVLRAAVASPWFPVFLVGIYAVRPFLGWPISVVSALVGFKYGLLVGVPIALVGAVATSVPPFVAGRRAPDDGRFFGRLSDGSRRFFGATGGLRGVVAARLAPTPPEAVSAAAGSGGVSGRQFAAGTLVGELPWVVAAVALGSGLEDFRLRAAHVDPAFVAGGVLAAALLLGPVAYRRLRA
ncbi:TVP38/TMEM64 family protein [Halobacterium litoreum]|uniref:TVP38/TMEM64 family protein n=1 Tax=Halobacterium litoreum TaxID=2039234 RepID=A0ABD5NCS1_9EURY|nr:VTT domain-containing protein [Halobacterium litoreum]UHH14028.1 VTT domain-containing protein [Halobacterium litoreum]